MADRERSRRGSPHAPAASWRPTEPPGSQAHAPPAAAEEHADDANLDALRGELVRELDRLAAADHGCSASFRRV
ncbi:MAG: hypothetical protein QOK25_2905 [Thermoleophilaceae bacterium]|nr:hypothetical protein [Thermoleophilaceae bacterium]